MTCLSIINNYITCLEIFADCNFPCSVQSFSQCKSHHILYRIQIQTNDNNNHREAECYYRTSAVFEKKIFVIQ